MPTIEKTLHELGNGLYAYTQLPGSWGWSNAGLITDSGESLLVDTLFDERITVEMLSEMRRATPAAARIGTVVNTHGNGDHCYGNALVSDAQIIATRGCVADLRAAPASRNRLLLRAAKLMDLLGGTGRAVGKALSTVGVDKIAVLTEAGRLAGPLFEPFDFSSRTVLPNRTFEGTLSLFVGNKKVELMEVGPAHTRGDAVVWVPGDKILFTGDILFNEGHPVMWQGPIGNWIAALDRLLALDIQVVVPGHGPLTDKTGLRAMKRYLEKLEEQARGCFDAGLSVEEAARQIDLSEFEGWLDAERVYVNVHTLYREFQGDQREPDVLALFAGMARLSADSKAGDRQKA